MGRELGATLEPIDTDTLLSVLTKLKSGDFTARMPQNWTGINGKIADTLNEVIGWKQNFSEDIKKVNHAISTEGRISQRVTARLGGGGWAEIVNSVNDTLDSLSAPINETSRMIEAVSKGDLLQSVPLEMEGRKLDGEFLRAAKLLNTMVEQLNIFSSEVTRVAREVGTEGKLGGQAKSEVLMGSWKVLADAVNLMASNLTDQVRNISEVTVAVAGGDLSRKITVDVRGEFLQMKEAINGMVEQLRSFASEVTRVAKEVGTEGVLGGQAVVPGVAGTWKDLTESVNGMAANLTSQVRNIAQVTTAVANGDLAKKMTVEAKGEILELKNTLNTMVDQLNSFASEVTRVAKEVGTEGVLGGQGEVKGVAGTWKDLTESVNGMASNLTSQVRNIAQVTTAVANGDLNKKITVEAKGEILELKNTINSMVDQLNSFASEVTRVAKEVGTEGVLGGQAEVKGVAGTWKDLTESVNGMASNLTGQVRNIAQVTTAVANGDLAKKMTVEAKGEILELKNTLNTMVDQLNSFASEVTRVAKEVGTEGVLGGQAEVKGVAGTWKDLTENVNMLAGNLTSQVRNIAQVTTAVANGDLAKKITVEAKGEILELKNTINTMVDQLNSFASEVTRVAKEVGTEGVLGGQAEVKGVAGTWKDLTESVNGMASNLTSQVRNIAQVTTAVANGDLAKKITVEAKGEILELKDTINTMVDQLNAFASEVTRVAREVGTDGMLGGQAAVPGVAGTWKDLTENVNMLAGNLTSQVRNIAQVTTAVANGDLAKKITVEAKGEILELKSTINTMVDQLNAFASEVTRVAREVGTDGKLGGQAAVPGAAGTWKDLTESVNGMAANLTGQVRNIAQVTTAVATGDLAKKITVEAKGEILELKNTINTMVDQLSSFASEVTRVAREVGTDGKLGGQADVKGVAGTWKDLTESVNFMAANLTGQVRNIAQVTTAVATGDLAKKITVEAKGEILELKSTINTMVDQLNAFAAEVTRVAKEVGTAGVLGGQAAVPGVAGTWKDLTESVNGMAANLTGQVRNIAQVTTAVANGDLNKKITVEAKGEILELKNTINIMVDQLNAFASEVTRVAREVGTDGKLGGQADVKGVGGTWKDLTESVNSMASNLTSQVRNIAQVTTAVATGDLAKKITVEARGEILELKNTINTMVDQLNSFASEVTRVAREVGTDGKLGGQAEVKGVGGTWKDLTDSVNLMASNLTDQVRGIAKVVTAVAVGDLRQKIVLQAKGEIASLGETINSMIDTLATFADQVTGVAKEVGVDGKLGGQAEVPGAAGIWKDLTNNVNQLAANLTNQMRAIADVATSVTKGDLSRTVQVAAKGEMEELKNNINEMIKNLKGTTERNNEQDWLKTNLTKFTRMLQGQRDLLGVAQSLLSEIAPVVNAHHGVFYIAEYREGKPAGLKLLASYAYKERKNLSNYFKIGEGLIGQCAYEKQRIMLTNVPPDHIQIATGLGESVPINLIMLPILFEGNIKGVIELASFDRFSAIHQTFLDQLVESIGIVFSSIEASSKTEDLLKQSQSMGDELKRQQEELQQTNEELEVKAKLLEDQRVEVERKNMEIEQAKSGLEEKAAQLTLTSKYKSEFLANMSHELRTPLNSLLLLSKQLTENQEGNLKPKQLEYASTINSSGQELLSLINDILDLAKIESGTVTPELGHMEFSGLRESVERGFRHIAETKRLGFDILLAASLPPSIYTDGKRVHQVIKNLLSNAFKFTSKGTVSMAISPAASGWDTDIASLSKAKSVIGFRVKDSGIGIPKDKQRIIFESFQQADGGTSRKFGGTGLGLSISREIARMLGGELRLTESEPGVGSTFTLFLPDNYEGAGSEGPAPARRRPADSEPQASYIPEEDAAPRGAAPEFADDRKDLRPGAKRVVIVEDDRKFAKILMDLAREKGYQAVVTASGADAVDLVKKHKPDGIFLDINLPDIDGWTVLERLKLDTATRHIPVQVVTVEDEKERALRRGAFAYLMKPVTGTEIKGAFDRLTDYAGRPRKLLLIEDNPDDVKTIVKAIGNNDVKIKSAATAEAGMALLKKEEFDCLLLDLKLPKKSGYNVLGFLKTNPALRDLPVIVYTGKDLNEEEKRILAQTSARVLTKGGGSLDKLLDETSLFLHRITSALPDEKRRVIERLYASDTALKGKTILIVDDDVRNIFALTAALEKHQVKILRAESGAAALAALEKNKDTDLVLMDIMMPDMDGYEATRRIRKEAKFKDLPIIALTAKAMKGDREKCLEAGASDYITKPVDMDQLLSLLRVWLYK